MPTTAPSTTAPGPQPIPNDRYVLDFSEYGGTTETARWDIRAVQVGGVTLETPTGRCGLKGACSRGDYIGELGINVAGATAFHGVVILDDATRPSHGSVDITVLGDDVKLSDHQLTLGAPLVFDIDVTGKRRITIRASCNKERYCLEAGSVVFTDGLID